MTRFEARRYRRAIETGSQSLPDEAALEVVELFPDWSPTDSYEVNQRVRYESVLYRCLQAHTAQEAWTPVAAPSLWAKVLIPDENVIPEWEQPDSTNPYQIGDVVTHIGKTWESTVADNVWEPGVYGWVEVEDDKVSDGDLSSDGPGSENTDSGDAGSSMPEWEQRYGHNPYMSGDKVLYNGNVYESTFDGNTYSPDTYPAGWKLIS